MYLSKLHYLLYLCKYLASACFYCLSHSERFEVIRFVFNAYVSVCIGIRSAYERMSKRICLIEYVILAAEVRDILSPLHILAASKIVYSALIAARIHERSQTCFRKETRHVSAHLSEYLYHSTERLVPRCDLVVCYHFHELRR